MTTSTNSAGTSRGARPGATRTWLAALVPVLLLAAVPAACSSGPTRSAAAFCGTMRSEKERILAQLHQVSGAGQGDDLASVLLGLGASVQAIGELRTYFHKLEQVAPEEIRTEVGVVAEQLDRQLDAAGDAIGNPLGGLANAVVGGLTMSGPLSSVDDYSRRTCDESI